MTSLFDDINQFDDGFLAKRREAVAVAHKRVQDRIGAYLRIAKTSDEYKARLDFVSDDVRQIVADVADEFSVDHDKLVQAIEESLDGEGVTDINMELLDAPSAVGEKTSAGHKDGCECGFCKNKGNIHKKDDDKVEGVVSDEEKADKDSSEPEWSEKVEEKESSTRVAEAPRDGGGAVKRVDLPKGDGKSVGTGPSPKMDRKQWKPNALNPSGNLPEVDSEMTGSPNPTKQQDLVDEKPDYEGDFLRDTDAVTTQQELPSADDTGQSIERNLSQEGQSSTWTEAQGDAVTPQVFASADPDVNPLKAILDAGFVPNNQVESAIEAYDGDKE